MIKLEWKTPDDVGVAEPKVTTLKRQPASPGLAQQNEILYVECITEPTSTPGKISRRSPNILPSAQALVPEASMLTTTRGIAFPVGETTKRTRIYIIYNPGKETNQPPARLLELNPPPQPEGTHEHYVWTTVTLDKNGAVVSVTPDTGTKDVLAEAAIASVQKWRFSEPWRTDDKGQASLRIPVVFTAPGDTPKEKQASDSNPILIKKPDMPGSEVPDESRGFAHFEFKVSKTGQVTELTLMRSNNPAWAELMADHYLAREYKPATKNGLPVEATRREGLGSAGSTLSTPYYTVSTSTELMKVKALPGENPAKSYDVPPSPENVPAGAYPFELLMQHIEAKVGFILAIDEKGKVAQPSSLDAEHEEFRLATRAMIDAYRFQAAKLGAKPVATAFKSDFTFGLKKGDVHPSDSARQILDLLKTEPDKIVSVEAVDRAPEQIVFLKPLMPSASWRQTEIGTAEIEFIIDKNGHAQLPRIVAATDPAFGYAAAQAVVFWRFTPLTKDGKPAIVRTRTTLKFPGDSRPLVDPLSASARP